MYIWNMPLSFNFKFKQIFIHSGTYLTWCIINVFRLPYHNNTHTHYKAKVFHLKFITPCRHLIYITKRISYSVLRWLDVIWKLFGIESAFEWVIFGRSKPFKIFFLIFVDWNYKVRAFGTVRMNDDAWCHMWTSSD